MGGTTMRASLGRIDRLLRDRTGQGMTEYILIIVVIVILAIFSVQMFGGKVGGAAQRAGDAITNGSCCTGHPPYVSPGAAP
jgi:Flp pilus assembly pilin Flp